MRREERKSEAGLPAPPHQCELNEAVRRRGAAEDMGFRVKQIRLKKDSQSWFGKDKIIVHENGVAWRAMRERHTGSRRAKAGCQRTSSTAGKEKRVGSGLLMGNDREQETEFVGSTWAGRIGDTGMWVGLGLGSSLAGFPQKGLKP